MDNACVYHSDHNNRIQKLEKDCEDLDDRLTELDKNTAVTNQRIVDALERLSQLPETMSEVSKTMVSMQTEISKSNEEIGGLKSQFNSLKDKIDEVDEDGKFNIRTCIKDNWIGIVMGAGALVYFLNQFLK